MIRCLFITIFLLCRLQLSHAEAKGSGLFSVEAGIYYEGYYQLGIGMHYMLCQYVGVGGECGIWSNAILPELEDGFDDSDILRPFIRPSLVAYTPYFKKWKQGELNFRAETSCMINATVSNYVKGKRIHSRIFSFGGELGPNFRSDSWSIGIAYCISNLDFGKERSNSRKGFRSKIAQGLFLRFGYIF